MQYLPFFAVKLLTYYVVSSYVNWLVDKCLTTWCSRLVGRQITSRRSSSCSVATFLNMVNTDGLIHYVSCSKLKRSLSCSVSTSRRSSSCSIALLLFKQNLSSINGTSFSYVDEFCQDALGSDYHPKMMSWNTSTDCCNWEGVICDDSTGDVIGLDLTCGMLQGTIHPESSLFNLTHLTYL